MASVDHAWDVRSRVLAQLAGLLAPDIEVERSTRLEELDVDSVDLVELLNGLESEFDIELPHEGFAGAEIVGDVIDLVDRALELDAESRAARAAEPAAPVRALAESGLVRWAGAKPAPPTPVRLEGEGPSAADYVAEGRR